jgi:transmembrane sensor
MPSFISRPAELILKNLRGELSDEQEQKEFDQLVKENEKIQLLLQRLSDDDYARAQIELIAGFGPVPDWSETETAVIIKPRKTAWWKYAAAILIMLGAGSYFLNKNPAPQKEEIVNKNPQTLSEKKTDSLHNRGYLLLPDSSKIGLDTASEGIMALQNGSKFRKDNKTITPESPPKKLATEYNTIEYYTLVADKGGDFRLYLPDSTLVWLNAGSAIRFPVRFTGRERKVEIVGEAFFEVTENASKPFIVTSGYAEAEVLGTDFNIKAHAGDSIITTVVEGSVKVSSGGKSETVLPGKQIVVSRSGKLGKPKEAKLDRVTAWKYGKFDFRDQDLPDILAELGRWYDLEVDLSKVPNVKRAGVYPRSIPIIEVLIHLSAPSGVQLKLEGKKIVIN